MTFAIIAGVLVFWGLLTCLVLLERGRVVERGRIGSEASRAMIRMTQSFRELEKAYRLALGAFHEEMKRAGLLDPCPYCGHHPLDHVHCSREGCVVVEGSLPLAVATPPTYEDRR